MFAHQQLNELVERRRLPVMEADLHRSLIGLERENPRPRLAGLQAARGRTASRGPRLAGSAIAGLPAIRHWRKLARWIPTALTAWRRVQSLKGK